MYQDFNPCELFSRAADMAAGCGVDSTVKDRTRSGRTPGNGPGQRPSPVMPDQVGPLEPRRVEQCDDVADEFAHPVVAATVRQRGGDVPALGGNQGAEPLRVQVRDDVVIGRCVLGKAVQQHHRVAAHRAEITHGKRRAGSLELVHSAW